MSTFLNFLRDLSAAEWAAIAVASWAILAFGVGCAVGRGVRIADQREPVPPPAPAPRVREDDGEWLGFWPAGDADEVRVRLEQIAAAEGWDPITEEWAS